VTFTVLQEQLMQVLGGLTNREADVIKARYGLTDGQPKTHDEIGKVLRCSNRERIRQIESKTMSEDCVTIARSDNRTARLPRLNQAMTNAKVFINPKSGSIRITGTVDMVDAEGNLIETLENPKFCGCGTSREKPLCDGSHKGLTQN
jgi:hypothetical protein